jgi:hypothetical protein
VTPDPIPVVEGFLEEAIVGWRIWNLAENDDGPRLRPAGSGVDAWAPGRKAEARCTAKLLSRTPHPAPDPRCQCGIHASRSLDTFGLTRPAWPPPSVVGTVSLWGTVIEHELGWRAQYAYPARLRLVCSMCAWFEPGPGLPEVVHSFSGNLYTLCSSHRGGIEVQDGRRTRPTGIDPVALQSRLLDTYAVDLVPLEAVRSLFRRPATPAPPGYVPSIRVVPVDQENRDHRTGLLRAMLDAIGW